MVVNFPWDSTPLLHTWTRLLPNHSTKNDVRKLIQNQFQSLPHATESQQWLMEGLSSVRSLKLNDQYIPGAHSPIREGAFD